MVALEPEVTVYNLAGEEIIRQSLLPDGLILGELKAAIQAKHNVPVALQKLIVPGQDATDKFVFSESIDVSLIVDETSLWSWDLAKNPDKDLLKGQGGDIVYEDGRYDYINVVTQEPVSQGRHFFELKMHQIGDEQVCGVVQDSSQAGHRYGIRSLLSWSYYCGRRPRGWGGGSLIDGKASLHANGYAVTQFDMVSDGDVIGMLLDVDRGALVFMLNGKLQGACEVPREPLYINTHLDAKGDRVELTKPPLEEVPQEALDALEGPFLCAEEGDFFCRRLMMRPKSSEPKSEIQVKPTRAESRKADEEPVETIST